MLMKRRILEDGHVPFLFLEHVQHTEQVLSEDAVSVLPHGFEWHVTDLAAIKS